MSERPASLPLALAVTVTVQGLATTAVLALTTIAPLVARDLAVPAHTVGYQVSVVYLLAAIGSLLAGGVVRKYGPARASQCALVAGAAGLVGLAVGGLGVALFASMMLGAGYALTNPAASDLLNRITPPSQRNLIFSLKQTGVPLGGIFAGLVLPSLALVLGWRGSLLALAALPLAVAVLLQAARPRWDRWREPATTLRASTFDGLKLVWGLPALRALSLMGLVFSAIQLSLVSFAVVMLVSEFGWDPVSAGMAAAAVQFSGAVGRVAWGAVADRLQGGLVVLAIIGLVTAGSAGAMVGAHHMAPWMIVGLLMLFGVASIGWNGVMLAEAARLSPPGQVGPVAGGVLMLTFAGVVLGPATFAAAYQLIGSYSDTFALFAAAPLVGSVLAWAGNRTDVTRMASAHR